MSSLKRGDRMVPFMPRFLAPTETLYSLCSRYAHLTGNPDSQPISRALLGHRRASCLHAMPAGLGHLCEISVGLVVLDADLLRRRSGLAALWPFLDQRKRQSLLEQAASPPLKGTRQPSGLQWNVLPKTVFLRHCSHCLRKDLQETGVPIWRNEHQLPGVWICLEHRTRLSAVEVPAGCNRWALPGNQRSVETAVSIDCSPELANLAKAMSWISEKDSLSSVELSVMVRGRLAIAGFSRTDITIADEDLARFNVSQIMPLTAAGCPDLKNLPRDPRWIREVLADRRALHPAKWGVLIATSGDCEFNALDRDLREAQTRVSPMSLPGTARTRRTRAPDRLYEALQKHRLLSDACSACLMTLSEGRAWMRRDGELQMAWSAAKIARRREHSRSAVLNYLKDHPTALRSELIHRCGRHVRWLFLHDLAWIEGVLPRALGHLASQRELGL
ncbi:TniQ family protein [Roseateles sp. So40a]|uniref:TniQ family protein n=1 Tax=Roseateles sp. So40a TaxID=3400226 RepID=UPI003A8554E5